MGRRRFGDITMVPFWDAFSTKTWDGSDFGTCRKTSFETAFSSRIWENSRPKCVGNIGRVTSTWVWCDFAMDTHWIQNAQNDPFYNAFGP